MLSNGDVKQWLTHPTTLEVFAWLKDQRIRIEEDMVSRAVILDPKASQRLCEYVGMREMIDRILHVSIEDLDYEEDQSGGLQDISSR